MESGDDTAAHAAAAANAATSPVSASKCRRDWRELLLDVGVVVVGIVIALTADQIMGALTWHFKVQTAETAIRTELGLSVSGAVNHKELGPCTNAYLDTLETAIVRNDARTIQSLYDMGPPISLLTWGDDTWTSALNGEIADHIPNARVVAYASVFRAVAAERELLIKATDEFPSAFTGRFNLPQDPGAISDQLAVVDRLRNYEHVRQTRSEFIIRVAEKEFQIAPASDSSDHLYVDPIACRTNLAAIRGRAAP